jgi:hypothetical protein
MSCTAQNTQKIASHDVDHVTIALISKKTC